MSFYSRNESHLPPPTEAEQRLQAAVRSLGFWAWRTAPGIWAVADKLLEER